MATTKKTPNKRTPMPSARVEHDYGIKGQRRTKELTDANKAQKFRATKRKAGKKTKVLNAASKDKAVVAPQARSVPGVRPMRTRTYLAGRIIAEYGLTAGVTGDMVTALDKAHGKPNSTESMYCLKNAFHAVRGYLGTAEDAIE